MRATHTRKTWKRVLSWSCVVAINLPVSAYLGLDATSRSGALGMMAGIVFCWLAGLAICVASERLETVLFRGGLFVAVSQFCPILQFGAGIFGILTWGLIARDMRLHSEGSPGVVAGLAVTLLTAQPLLVAAWLLGGGIGMLSGSDTIHTDDAEDYVEQVGAETATDPGPGIAPNFPRA